MDQRAFEGSIASLEASAAKVEADVRRVAAGDWEEVIQSGDGAWTRRQLLAHIASNDLRQLIRVRIGAGIPQPGDPQAHAEELAPGWNEARVAERAGRSVDGLLSEMRTNRAAFIDLLHSLTPAQRARPMPFRGEPTPLEQMVLAVIGHLKTHAAELF